MLIEKLNIMEYGSCGDPHYSLNEIKKTYNEVVDLDGGHWLALTTGEYETDFAMFAFASSTESDDDTQVYTIFRGWGTGSVLRECRHTYWGPDGEGYTFYLPAKAVVKALQYLEKYFDFN